jgi:hypothetical protein
MPDKEARPETTRWFIGGSFLVGSSVLPIALPQFAHKVFPSLIFAPQAVQNICFMDFLGFLTTFSTKFTPLF